MKFLLRITNQPDQIIDTDEATVGDLKQALARHTPEVDLRLAIAECMGLRLSLNGEFTVEPMP